MDKLYGILDMALPILAMLAVGMFFRSRQIISRKGIQDIKSFALNICLPASLFNTFFATEFGWKEGLLLVIMIIAMVACFALGKVVTRLLGLRRKSAPFLCCTIDGGGTGFPLYTLMFGSEELYHFALLNTGGAIIQWPLIMTLYMMLGKGKVSPKETVRSMITPINMAILAGVLCSVTGFGPMIAATSFGAVLKDTLSFVSAPTSTIMIMAVGYSLSFENIQWGETLLTVLARHLTGLIVCVGVLAVVSLIYPGDPLFRAAIILYYILPPTYVYSTLVTKEDEAYVGAFLPLDTAFTILCYIILTGILV